MRSAGRSYATTYQAGNFPIQIQIDSYSVILQVSLGGVIIAGVALATDSAGIIHEFCIENQWINILSELNGLQQTTLYAMLFAILASQTPSKSVRIGICAV
jgi:hypothetical protein